MTHARGPRTLRTLRHTLTALALLSSALPGRAQDVLTIGGANAVPGSTVSVPIYVRDVGGTPLGGDLATSLRIQGIAFKLAYSPTSAVSAPSISRAGITTTLTPLYEASPTAAGTVSWIASFSGTSNAVPLTLNKAGWGDQVAKLTLTVPANVPLHTKILLVPSASSAVTGLSNERGSAQETDGVGLTLVAGSVSVGPYWGDANLDGNVDVFDLTILANYVVGNVAAGVAPFLAPVDAMNLDPAKGSTVDVFDIVIEANAIVGNVPTLPVP